MIQVSLKYRPDRIRIAHYREQDLETHVACATCSLEFAVFTVFATCPDCGEPNALDVFEASMEVAGKRLHLGDALDDHTLQNDLVADALGAGVSAFDTLGKELRRRFPGVIPKHPTNPFQNLEVVATTLGWNVESGPFGGLDADERRHLSLMFQVRHVFEHNGGVVDERFGQKAPGMEHLLGRRYPLKDSDVEWLLQLLSQLGRRVAERVQALKDIALDR